MASFRLRRNLRYVNGGGTAFDSCTIEAADLEAAILAAKDERRLAPGLEVASYVLSTPSGKIVWSDQPPPVREGPSPRM